MTLYRVVAALLGWFAIGMQYWLLMTGDVGPDPLHRTINFFSYFTILSNILVAIAMTLPVIAPQSGAGRFFDSAGVRTALATYILVVGVTYHLLLRDLWDPQGWQKVVDYTLHYATPILFVLDWLLFVPKRDIAWSTALKALVFPVLYMIWTYVHGEWTGFYPYPFVDVSKLGLQQVLINAAGMSAAFALICFVLTAAGRRISATERSV